ncbi:MAG: 2-C-methyl-D-erythritol 4-phosphate cytidylyltransferase [Acidaminococcaceae bacterium]|nr:2-C-methyl-D-erythritol 4-phosphate cytidylyltransferase [Acidaminococcaceae bacterium]
MNVAIVLAGGTGSRVGANIPKQFIKIMGKPILAYTLDNFQIDTMIDAIEVVCHKDWLEEVQSICNNYEITKLRWLTTGGDTFQQSVLNGVLNLKDKIKAEDIVVISFGVSPFCTEDIINDSIRVAEEHGNGISAEDSALCTCIKDDEYSTTQNLVRETIKGFSNPWSFKFGELVASYEEVQRRGILNSIEPHTTSVYLALGKRLWFSKSSGHNFKITLKEDLERFEGLLLLKQKRRSEGIEVDW